MIDVHCQKPSFLNFFSVHTLKCIGTCKENVYILHSYSCTLNTACNMDIGYDAPFLNFKDIGRFCPITVRREGGTCIHQGGSHVGPDHPKASDCPPVKESSVQLLEAMLPS